MTWELLIDSLHDKNHDALNQRSRGGEGSASTLVFSHLPQCSAPPHESLN